MKLSNIKYIVVLLAMFGLASCETYPDQEVKYAAIGKMSGEWMTHVYQEDGTTLASPSLFAMRTYNTAANDKNKAWIRLGTTQAVAILAKVDIDGNAKTFPGQTVVNEVNTKGDTFTLVEGKILLDAQKLPSGATADSIVIKYSLSSNGQTYIVKGHRRTAWDPSE